VLAGHPDDPSWGAVHSEAAELLEQTRPLLSLSKKAKKHRRGHFGALSFGISHGGGQTVPGNLKQEGPNDGPMSRVMHHGSFERFSGFGSSTWSRSFMPLFTNPLSAEVLASWYPELHAYYADHLEALLTNDPGLVRNYRSSVFASATVNFGPRTLCFKHRDIANLPFGLCAITALGSFDPKRGGHLVLWECGLVIEFPAGSTVLIPSAVISHCNTAIGSNEHRYSFTQYSAGGLFRWVQHRFKLDDEYYSELTEEEVEEDKKRNASRWAEGLSMLSPLDKIRTPPVENK
jgi:hypothetical protein